MSDTDDIASLMDMLKEDTRSFNGMIIPVNDRNFDGAGIEDAQSGMSRMAMPMDLQSVAGITPPSSWEQFGTILVNDLLPRVTAEDILKRVAGGLVPGSSLVLDPIYLRAGRTILSDLPTFGTNAGLAYSDYIEESAVGIIDLIKMVATFMIEQETFAASLATLSLTLPANALLSTIFDPQSTLAQAVLAADADALLTEIAIAISQLPGADANLTMALAVVESLRSLRNLFSELVSMEPAELFDLIGEVPLFIAEMMRDRVLQTKLEEIADSPAMLGEIFGMLLAVVIWEIVEEVATMGLAKPMKLLKVAT
jgi:hypothetical protein